MIQNADMVHPDNLPRYILNSKVMKTILKIVYNLKNSHFSWDWEFSNLPKNMQLGS